MSSHTATSSSAAPAGGQQRAGAHVVVDHVSRVFEGRVRALDDVSFELRPGEAVALTGPSGSGKSTLLQIIGSLDRPDSGRVIVDGQPVGELRHPARFRRSTVGFVFQLHHLMPTLDAQTNVELPMIAAGIGPSARRERALELLDEVGLARRADHLPAQLSGGERQRVAVARALANHPRLLLADEPTGALDTQTSERVLDLLRQVRDRHGMTMLIVSYDPAVARYTDRALGLLDGQLRTDAPNVSGGPAQPPGAIE